MSIEAGVARLTNTKGKPYEDRYLLPLGSLPDRLDAAANATEEKIVQAKIDALRARGLVFAVVDGVGGAPLGMAAAQKTVDVLRRLYARPDLAPRERFPTAREVLALLYAANTEVAGWGSVDDDDAVPAGAGATGRPKGAACVTALYLSPANNVTLLQAGDTAAFIYRQRSASIALHTGEEDVAGRSVRKCIGLGDPLRIDTMPLMGLESGDLVALVTDGVYPKGFSDRSEVAAVLVESDGEPETAAAWLVERSRARGSVDDITALVLAIE